MLNEEKRIERIEKLLPKCRSKTTIREVLEVVETEYPCYSRHTQIEYAKAVARFL